MASDTGDSKENGMPPIAPPGVRKETVSASYPLWKKRLLESVQAQRGDFSLSETVRYGCDLVLKEAGLLPSGDAG